MELSSTEKNQWFSSQKHIPTKVAVLKPLALPNTHTVLVGNGSIGAHKCWHKAKAATSVLETVSASFKTNILVYCHFIEVLAIPRAAHHFPGESPSPVYQVLETACLEFSLGKPVLQPIL